MTPILTVEYKGEIRKIQIPVDQTSVASKYLLRFGALWLQIGDKWYYLTSEYKLYDDITKNVVEWPKDLENLKLFTQSVFDVIHFNPQVEIGLPEINFTIRTVVPNGFCAVAAISILDDINFNKMKVGKIAVKGTGIFSIAVKKLAYNTIEVKDFRFGPNAPVLLGEFI